MSKFNLTAADERRRFFRIDDAINLYYKIVDKQDVIAASKMSDDVLSNCSLVTALEMLDQESRMLMFRVEKMNLKLLNILNHWIPKLVCWHRL